MTRTVLFINGDAPSPELVAAHLHADDFIICADGGANHAAALGLRPHLIVGDMDSVNTAALTAFEAAGVTTERYPVAKDETDLDLTFPHILRRNSREVVVFGGLGGRLDHLLTNVMVFVRPDFAGIPVRFLDRGTTAVLMNGPLSITVPGSAGDTLSLIPLSSRVEGVSITAAQWPLANATLHLGSSLTMSNRMLGSSAAVSSASGALLVVHVPAQAPVR